MKKQILLFIVTLLTTTQMPADIPFLDPLMDSANSGWGYRLLFVASSSFFTGLYGYNSKDDVDSDEPLKNAGIHALGGAIGSILVLNLHALLSAYVPLVRSIVPVVAVFVGAWAIENIDWQKAAMLGGAVAGGGLVAPALVVGYQQIVPSVKEKNKKVCSNF